MHNIIVHIIDKQALRLAARQKGFSSFLELSQFLGIHRNTLQHYLNGRPVFPKSLEQIFEALQVDPSKILVKQGKFSGSEIDKLAPMIDEVHAKNPDFTFVLFGSRASQKNHKYSDWDIGVFREPPIAHDEFRKFLVSTRDLSDELPYQIDWVNMSRADQDFLKNASRSWQFLTGKRMDWQKLQEKADA